MRYKTWVNRFSADPKIINKPFVLNGAQRTLIGVNASPLCPWRSRYVDSAGPVIPPHRSAMDSPSTVLQLTSAGVSIRKPNR